MILSLGDKIKFIRNKKKLSVTELSRKIGKATTYIYNLENDVLDPKARNLRKVAEALCVSMEYLLDDKATSYYQAKDCIIKDRIKLLTPTDKKRISQIIDNWIEDYERKA